MQTEGLGIVTSVEGGVRFSQLEYERRGNINQDFSLNAGNVSNFGEVAEAIASTCIDDFPESGFLSEELSGRPLVVSANTDDLAGYLQDIADTGFVDPSVQLTAFNSFLSADSGCIFDVAESLGVELTEPNSDFNSSSVDVEESTFAAYIQANYESELFGFPARGNVGVRLVNTNVDSRTFRSSFEIDNNGSSFELDSSSLSETANALAAAEAAGLGFDSEVNESFSYTEVLPSATLVVDLAEDVLFRGGIFRGISRSDPALLGTRQQVGTVERFLDGATIDTDQVSSFLSAQTTTGGAVDLEAFTSWNVDAALEWYPNKDTILAAGVYYKKFRGGYENTVVDQDFLITTSGGVLADGSGSQAEIGDGGLLTVPVSGLQTTDETSNLYGIEITASHAFSYLPGFWGGFGAKLSYNYASSDFEFEDDFAGAGVGVTETGDTIDLAGSIPSAEIFGLSRNVASAQLYWSGEKFDFQVIGKHRSQYFQQFIDTPGRIRFVDDNTVLEFRASYKINDAVRLSFEALNITDEPRTDFRAVDGNINQVLSFGPRYYFGLRAKL